MEIITGTADFDKAVKDSSFIMVDFYAEWCGPCKMMAPNIEDMLLDEKYSDLKVIKVNVDNDMDLADRYMINSIPALFFFKDGNLKPVYTEIGYHTLSELKTLVDKVRDIK